MELRFLSAEMDDLVDPGPGAIWESLGQLSKSSGDNPPRAVLVHDNGKDFIQYVAKKKGRLDFQICHVQYCEYQGDGGGFSQYRSVRDRTIEETIELFQAFSAGGQEWKDKISWEPAKRTRSHRQVDRLATFLTIGFFAFVAGILCLFASIWIDQVVPGVVLLGVTLACSSFFLWIRPARLGAPWTGAGSGGGKGCGSGSCGFSPGDKSKGRSSGSGGGSCGGSGGGGGGGGGGGCGGCGGGG